MLSTQHIRIGTLLMSTLTGAKGLEGDVGKPENERPCLLRPAFNPPRPFTYVSAPWLCACKCCPANDWPRPTRHIAPPRVAAPLTAATTK